MGFLIIYCICSSLPYFFSNGSQYLATSVVISCCRTPLLTKIWAAIFYFLESVGLPHTAYILIH